MLIDAGRWQTQQGEPMEDRPSNESNKGEHEGIKQLGKWDNEWTREIKV